MKNHNISYSQAIELARNMAEVDNQAQTHELTIIDDEIGELWWAWVVPCCSKAYKLSRDPRDVLFGLGPYFVDKFSGEVISTGSGVSIRDLERKLGYRSWWKFWGGPKTLSEINYRNIT